MTLKDARIMRNIPNEPRKIITYSRILINAPKEGYDMTSHRYLYAGVAVLVVLVVGVAAGLVFLTQPSTSNSTISNGGLVQVVAAENFWGSLASQLGGTRVNVTSIVSDPNADPHEYQSNPANARAFANANLVIVNGAGYDSWAQSIINASNSPNRQILTVQNVVGLAGKSDLNPHFWYSPYYVNTTVHAMYKSLVAIDSADTSYFHQQYATLNASLYHSYMSAEAQIRQKFSGTPVAATEDIFVYMANATGLKVVSPVGFMVAVAEGNDPPAQDVVTFQQLLGGGRSTVKVLVYNMQTATPVTDQIKSLAAQNHIPIVGVTETLQPPGMSFQAWMGAELVSLQNALNT
jgi:zinc/manganese transport system substrate-binding protein